MRAKESGIEKFTGQLSRLVALYTEGQAGVMKTLPFNEHVLSAYHVLWGGHREEKGNIQ